EKNTSSSVDKVKLMIESIVTEGIKTAH
ncbi:hypothetical protein HKBW3S43_01816, partial [Candidatus Hakubella thermalkaliphila]